MTHVQNTPLFALDIGTRSVVGLLLEQNENQYQLIDSFVEEHNERAMLDGQIHDVPSVAKVILRVKTYLEERHGHLNKVCVAAAGRSLKTRRSEFTLEIENKPMLSRDDLLHLELSAVQNAQFLLANEQVEDGAFEYYCVGYSVLYYRLDGEPIGSLLDQTGKQASVEVIATFLPKVVVESLLAALSRADLELEALTLEPIAAINVLIPPSMRRLNVALVDIGAGTSDIAITDENTIIAYGMVPVAGDEITEAISDSYLLDFPDAEKMKRQLLKEDLITIQDILGVESTLEKSVIVESITGAVENLANSISNEIMNLNGKAPQAVMLVGGGSLTPLLPQMIANRLNLSESRVAIRGADAIKLLKQDHAIPLGPELVTPIGIAIAAKENPIEYISVTINDRTLRLFDIKTLTVGDGLLAAGIEIAKLYGKPGLAIMATVQNQLISIPGEHGHPPVLLKNNEPTTLDAPLTPGDAVIVEPGKNGAAPSVTLRDLIEDEPNLTVFVNGIKKQFASKLILNGKVVTKETPVQDRDHITVQQVITVNDLFDALQLHDFLVPITLFINDKKWIDSTWTPTILVNNKPSRLDQKLTNLDRIDWEAKTKLTVSDLLQAKKVKVTEHLTVFFNEKPITLERPLVEVHRENKRLTLEDELQTNDCLKLTRKETSDFIVQDLFSFVDLNIDSLTGKKLILKKNGEDTFFSSELYSGDKIELIVKDVSSNA
ncbi:cell division protein FtsA [Halalkalibacter akibai]|uniref:Cell division protein FtsA n=1 Tax=Halalkalibacter akibai (strain ATCC 43226 / DSM 21942 / CIP 109018 / JCM 9157 / 1139) TaxID=1236973 RepID=W4QPY7_HALA3|nr:cell division protein FtsA [Halalkalibacter akibai]GAE34175.1 cell division protein FtsA [Halalkalibacter akibai JCM 9157]